MPDESIYFTTPIYYVNAEPHLGHTYTTVVADTLVRFWRQRGRDAFFVTGTDEHGDKIAQAAAKAGVEPKAFADRVSGVFRSTWEQIGLQPGWFVRTTDPAHVTFVQDVLRRIHARGDVYFSSYRGLYCTGCERFYQERELVDGVCPDHRTPPVEIAEENYFFRMGAYQERLRETLETRPELITPDGYRREVLALLREPIGDLCISRPKTRLTWGIELPFDDRYVAYVWCDALTNGEREKAGAEWLRIRDGAKLAKGLGLEVHAGHGLDYMTAEAIAALPEIVELNIGHHMMGEAVFSGLAEVVAKMRTAMDRGRAKAAL